MLVLIHKQIGKREGTGLRDWLDLPPPNVSIVRAGSTPAPTDGWVAWTDQLGLDAPFVAMASTEKSVHQGVQKEDLQKTCMYVG